MARNTHSRALISIRCSARSSGAIKLDLRRFQHPDVSHRCCTSTQDRRTGSPGASDRSRAATGHGRRSAAGDPASVHSDQQARSYRTGVPVVLEVVDDVFGIEKADVLRAGEIAQNYALLSARDAVHIAVMERHGIRSILSFDADFDRWPGLKR